MTRLVERRFRLPKAPAAGHASPPAPAATTTTSSSSSSSSGGGGGARPPGHQDVRPPWDVICGSDLIYYTFSDATPHSRLLLAALRQLAGAETLIVLSLGLHHNPEEVRACCVLSVCVVCACRAKLTPPVLQTHPIQPIDPQTQSRSSSFCGGRARTGLTSSGWRPG